MKAFPVDIFGVKRLGVDEWQKDFFWPVSDLEFFSMIDRIEDLFHRLIKESGPTIRDILISNSGLIQQCGMVLHALVVLDRLKKKGNTVLYDDRSMHYYELLSGNLKPFSGEYKAKFPGRLKNRVKQTAKFFFKNNINLSSIRKTMSGDKAPVSLGSFVRLKKEYCKQNDLLVIHKSDFDFFEQHFSASQQRLSEIEDVLQDVLLNITDLAKDYQIFLDSFQKNFLIDSVRKPLHLSYLLYNGIIQRYPKEINLLLLSEVAKSNHKTICLALKHKFNTKIIGFEHGNTFGTQCTPDFWLNELIHCDEYVLATSNSIQNYAEGQSLGKFLNGAKTRFTSVDDDYYSRLVEKNMKVPMPGKTKRVMLIGFPMNQYRYTHLKGHFSLFHLDLELRLLGLMKKMGFDVIYKAHPDRLMEIRGIFDGKADEIRTEPFEDVSHSCDAFLFTHTDTSTFGIALCTNKPVIAIEIQGKLWCKNVYKLVSKRCRMVSAHLDENCRIVFDEQAFKRALTQDPDQPNMEYLEKMAFS